jgi:hypothetical protein
MISQMLGATVGVRAANRQPAADDLVQWLIADIEPQPLEVAAVGHHGQERGAERFLVVWLYESKPEASLNRLCELAQEARNYRDCLRYYPFVLGAPCGSCCILGGNRK